MIDAGEYSEEELLSILSDVNLYATASSPPRYDESEGFIISKPIKCRVNSQ